MNKQTSQNGHNRILDIVSVFYNSQLMKDAIMSRYTTFQELADFIGQSADDLEKDLLTMMKVSSQEMIEYYKTDPIEPVYLPMLEEVQDSNNYWLRLSVQELYFKTKVIDTFLKYYPYIQEVGNPYLLKIGAALPYPITALDSADDYYDFLFQIPFVYTFELDFNAFISLKTNNIDVPFIRYNYQLFSVLDAFVTTVCSVILESSDDYQTSSLRQMENIRDVSQEIQVTTSILIQVKMMMGEVAMLARPDMSKQASYNLHHGIATAITPFLYCHELGHLFLGHLEKDHSKQMEYDADIFASLYIQGLIDEQGESVKFKIFLGLAALFCLLYCREQLLNLNNLDVYPTAMERYLHIAALFDKSDHPRMVKAWNNVVMASDYTLVKNFNITVPFAKVGGQ